jgi:hypothetical protein
MTNPFATNEVRPEPVSEDLVSQANARDYSANLLDFPDFDMDVPEISRSNGRTSGPAMPRDPEQAAILKAILTFKPMTQAKAVGFTRTGNKAVDDKTENLASKVSLAARKHGVKVIRRTTVHPHDVNKPSHEQRHVLALWRAADSDDTAN